MSGLIPIAASAHAGAIDRITTLVHLLMLVLFVGWSVYFIWVLIRFRQKRQPASNPAGTRGRVAFWTEVGVVVAEAVLLVVFALPLWYNRMAAQPREEDATVIRVTAEQFTWNVHYPGPDGRFGENAISLIAPDNPIGLNRRSRFGADDVVDIGRIHVPINRLVLIQLSSKDVIHSFGVPAMRLKRDAVPGLIAPVWFTPTIAGVYEIACSQLCGLAHYRMRGTIIVESDEAFRAFLDRESASQR